MKIVTIFLLAVIMTFMISCSQKEKSNTTTPTNVTQEDDKKVKFKFDSENKELEIETDKVDIKLAVCLEFKFENIINKGISKSTDAFLFSYRKTIGLI